jgi:hypothetical protein
LSLVVLLPPEEDTLAVVEPVDLELEQVLP